MLNCIQRALGNERPCVPVLAFFTAACCFQGSACRYTCLCNTPPCAFLCMPVCMPLHVSVRISSGVPAIVKDLTCLYTAPRMQCRRTAHAACMQRALHANKNCNALCTLKEMQRTLHTKKCTVHCMHAASSLNARSVPIACAPHACRVHAECMPSACRMQHCNGLAGTGYDFGLALSK